MAEELGGRVVAITGASARIGFATTRVALAHGASVSRADRAGLLMRCVMGVVDGSWLKLDARGARSRCGGATGAVHGR
jgi:NAD(P)-dependent dehydrogenase (short-subunit alcohol dehydrogenase family)